MTDDETPSPTPPPRPAPLWAEYLLRAAGGVVACAAALVFAVVEAFLVPLRVGGWYVPVSVVLAVAVNLALPRLTLWLSRLRSVALLPGLVWFVVVIAATMPSAQGDLVIHDAWPGLALLLAGSASVAVAGYRVVTAGGRSAMKS